MNALKLGYILMLKKSIKATLLISTIMAAPVNTNAQILGYAGSSINSTVDLNNPKDLEKELLIKAIDGSINFHSFEDLMQLYGKNNSRLFENLYLNLDSSIFGGSFVPSSYFPVYLSEIEYQSVLNKHMFAVKSKPVVEVVDKEKASSETFSLGTASLLLAGLGGALAFAGGSSDSKNIVRSPTPPTDINFVPSSRYRSISDYDDFSGANLRELFSDAKRITPYSFYENGIYGQGVKVAVMDSGIDAAHFDLKNQIDYAGSISSSGSTITDSSDHGTHVAGTIAAEHNNYGMHGIAPQSTLLSYDVLNFSSKRYSYLYRTAIDNGAQVINSSWGYSNDNYANRKPFESYNDMVKSYGKFSKDNWKSVFNYLKENDVISVWSVGNDGLPEPGTLKVAPVFDSDLQDHWVNVVALNDSNKIASFSNYCGVTKEFCISAPGTSIYSTSPNNSYSYKQGTSMAAPVVSGSIALLRSAFPKLSSGEILDILYETADDLGAEGVDEIYGHGALNLGQAFLPVGELTVSVGSDLDAKSYKISDTNLTIGGGISDAVLSAEVVQEATINSVDKYNREYDVNVASMIAQDNEKVSLLNVDVDLGDFVVSLEKDFSSNYGEILEYLDGNNSIEYGSDNTSIILSYGDNSTTFVVDNEASFSKLRVNSSIGYSLDNGGILGGKSSGAFIGASSKTSVFMNTVSYQLGKIHSIKGYLNVSDTDFSSSYLNGRNITRSEQGISYISESPLGKFELGLAKPLSVDSGTIELSTLGVESNEITEQKISSKTDYKLHFGYQKDLISSSFVSSISAGLELYDDGNHLTKVSYALTF